MNSGATLLYYRLKFLGILNLFQFKFLTEYVLGRAWVMSLAHEGFVKNMVNEVMFGRIYAKDDFKIPSHFYITNGDFYY